MEADDMDFEAGGGVQLSTRQEQTHHTDHNQQQQTHHPENHQQQTQHPANNVLYDEAQQQEAHSQAHEQQQQPKEEYAEAQEQEQHHENENENEEEQKQEQEQEQEQDQEQGQGQGQEQETEQEQGLGGIEDVKPYSDHEPLVEYSEDNEVYFDEGALVVEESDVEEDQPQRTKIGRIRSSFIDLTKPHQIYVINDDFARFKTLLQVGGVAPIKCHWFFGWFNSLLTVAVILGRIMRAVAMDTWPGQSASSSVAGFSTLATVAVGLIPLLSVLFTIHLIFARSFLDETVRSFKQSAKDICENVKGIVVDADQEVQRLSRSHTVGVVCLTLVPFLAGNVSRIISTVQGKGITEHPFDLLLLSKLSVGYNIMVILSDWLVLGGPMLFLGCVSLRYHVFIREIKILDRSLRQQAVEVRLNKLNWIDGSDDPQQLANRKNQELQLKAKAEHVVEKRLSGIFKGHKNFHVDQKWHELCDAIIQRVSREERETRQVVRAHLATLVVTALVWMVSFGILVILTGGAVMNAYVVLTFAFGFVQLSLMVALLQKMLRRLYQLQHLSSQCADAIEQGLKMASIEIDYQGAENLGVLDILSGYKGHLLIIFVLAATAVLVAMLSLLASYPRCFHKLKTSTSTQASLLELQRVCGVGQFVAATIQRLMGNLMTGLSPYLLLLTVCGWSQTRHLWWGFLLNVVSVFVIAFATPTELHVYLFPALFASTVAFTGVKMSLFSHTIKFMAMWCAGFFLIGCWVAYLQLWLVPTYADADGQGRTSLFLFHVIVTALLRPAVWMVARGLGDVLDEWTYFKHWPQHVSWPHSAMVKAAHYTMALVLVFEMVCRMFGRFFITSIASLESQLWLTFGFAMLEISTHAITPVAYYVVVFPFGQNAAIKASEEERTDLFKSHFRSLSNVIELTVIIFGALLSFTGKWYYGTTGLSWWEVLLSLLMQILGEAIADTACIKIDESYLDRNVLFLWKQHKWLYLKMSLPIAVFCVLFILHLLVPVIRNESH